MKILGISAYYHDSAAAFIQDGEVVAAAQEERFTRKRHDARFPAQAAAYCLAEAQTRLREVDVVAFYDKPLLKFQRLLFTYLAMAPRGFNSFRVAIPTWAKDKMFQRSLLAAELRRIDPAFDAGRLLFNEHHMSHAASAFFPSPFQEAVVLTMDGVGEWTTTSAGLGRGNSLVINRELRFPHSLGLLYSAFTSYTGFRVNSGEYKLMGLAPYGVPRYVDSIMDHLIDLKDDGTFRLNLDYFDFCTELRMTNDRFHDLFGGPPRRAEAALTQRDMDLAASIQKVTETVVLRLTSALAQETGIDNLCLAGGVALNCVANAKIARQGHFKRIWIQPAAGDAGGALGAAFTAYYQVAGRPRHVGGGDAMKGSYLGPSFEQPDIERELRAAGAAFRVLSEEDLMNDTARTLAEGQAIGWFSGRMEFGPRALGARSILGDPRSPTMQSTLNLKVKFRESFRPFAPAVLSERVSQWFETSEASPYMLMVADVAATRRRPVDSQTNALLGLARLAVPRSDIPAVTHLDGSARLQTVHRETNPRFHKLLERFEILTGCPVLVNTSFNVRGEPIVCTPTDAYRCFMGTDIDRLVVGNCVLSKGEQATGTQHDHHRAFEAD
jgi:carbamoyltransferase